MGIIINCRLVVDVDCEAGAADGANEILRDDLRHFAPGSCLVDYALDGFTPYQITDDYSEGEAFGTPTAQPAGDAGTWLQQYTAHNYDGEEGANGNGFTADDMQTAFRAGLQPAAPIPAAPALGRFVLQDYRTLANLLRELQEEGAHASLSPVDRELIECKLDYLAAHDPEASEGGETAQAVRERQAYAMGER